MGKGSLSYAATVVLQAVSSGYLYGFDIIDVSGLPGGTVYPPFDVSKRLAISRRNGKSRALPRPSHDRSVSITISHAPGVTC